jgi:hypothetical protein
MVRILSWQGKIVFGSSFNRSLSWGEEQLTVRDVAIIGSGCAGLTAVIYAARAHAGSGLSVRRRVYGR